MSDEEISVRSDSSVDDFESDVEDIEEEQPLSEEKPEDEEEEEEDEEDNGEPDPWVDDMFDEAMSQDSENGVGPSSVGQSSFVHNGFLGPAPNTVGNSAFSVVGGSYSSTTANAAAKKKPAKQSNNYMTTYEFTKIIGVRSEQIMHGSQVLIQTTSIDPIQIAKEELKAGMIPLRIRRTLPDKGGVKIEDWYVHEFENIEALLEFFDY